MRDCQLSKCLRHDGELSMSLPNAWGDRDRLVGGLLRGDKTICKRKGGHEVLRAARSPRRQGITRGVQGYSRPTVKRHVGVVPRLFDGIRAFSCCSPRARVGEGCGRCFVCARPLRTVFIVSYNPCGASGPGGEDIMRGVQGL